MAEKPAADKIPLTVYLPAELARRLQAAAEARRLAAADVVVDLLDRYLPRSGPKKGKIPYA